MPEVLPQAMLVVDVVEQRGHELAHCDGLPVRRAPLAAGAGVRGAPLGWGGGSRRGMITSLLLVFGPMSVVRSASRSRRPRRGRRHWRRDDDADDGGGAVQSGSLRRRRYSCSPRYAQGNQSRLRGKGSP